MFQGKYCALKMLDLFSGQIAGRKKLQKIGYILKSILPKHEWPFSYKYHFFGPYSQELTMTVSEMVTANAIEESCSEINGIARYDYALSSTGKELLRLLENNKLVEPYLSRGEADEVVNLLIGEDSSVLEVACTILFFLDHSDSLEVAFDKTKKLKPQLESSFEPSKSLVDRLLRIRRQSSN